MVEDIRRLLAEEAKTAKTAKEHRGDDVPLVRSRRPAKEPAQVYSLRIPVEKQEELRRVAKERNPEMIKAGVPQVTASESAASAATAVLPAEQYVAGLARKRMAAGVLFRDSTGRVLLVEPSYKSNWEIPGGAVEAEESPWAAATRELVEELGWDRPLGRLLVVDHVAAQDSRPEGVVFVFDGGVLGETDLVGMVFPDSEIVSAGLYTLEEARHRVKPLLADRLASALQAVDQGVTVLCEQGQRVA
jgi:ADP-ribose pyrophosphatase YjhB (NUDIX family)